jgi:uncharacterized RDD family membrane protein YckC
MSEQRNPYATSEVPLEVPVVVEPGLNDAEFGGFWRRFGAAFLDGLIVMPVTILAVVGLGFTRLFYVYYLVPGMAFMAFYYMYLVKRNGGTPGKRILDMRITMADGTPLTTKAAILRNIVEWGCAVLSTLSFAMAGMRIADAQFEPLGYLQKLQMIGASAPRWNTIPTYGTYAWFLIGAIVMLSSAKRRGIHDLLAGTVVVRTR